MAALLIFICPQLLKSNPLYDEASFKLYINKQPISYVTTFLSSDRIYINLSEYLTALEYPYKLYGEERRIETCYPNKSFCFVIKDNNISGDSIKQQYPDDTFLWEDDALFVNFDFIKNLSSFSIKISINSLSIYITANARSDIPLLKWMAIKSKYDRVNVGTGAQSLIDTIPFKYLRFNSVGYSLTTRGVSYDNNNELALNGVAAANGELFKGQFNAQYNFTAHKKNTPNSYIFTWSKINLNSRLVKQLTLFRSNSNMIMASSYYTNGILISNISDTRIGFRNYIVEGKTTPNTQVEIYNNNQFIEIATSDSLGNYKTEIPVGGGDNNVSTVIYDDYGNSYTQNQIYFLPPNLEPNKHFSYKLSSGVMSDRNFYYQFLANYGLTNRITLSVGSEGIWNKKINKLDRLEIFTLRAYFAKFAPVELNYIPDVKWSVNGGLNAFQLINVFYNYQKYNRYQTKIYNNPLQIWNVNFSGKVPIRRFDNMLFLTFQSNRYANFEFFNSNLTFNVNIRKFSCGFNMSSYSQQEFKFDNFIYGLRTGYKFVRGLYAELFFEYSELQKSYRIRSRSQYSKSNKSQFFIETFWDSKTRGYNIAFGMGYNFKSVNLRSVLNKGNSFASADLNVMGSVIFEEKGDFMLSNNFSAGAHIRFIPFLDVNANGQYDKDEIIMPNIKISSKTNGEIVVGKKSIDLINVTPNRSFKITIPKQSLTDISWQIEPCEFNFFMYPYQSHTIYIPIHVLSEISGRVFYEGKLQRLVNRLKIVAKSLDNNKSYISYTDDWGYYYISGVTAGKYVVYIAEESLEKRNLQIVEGREAVKNIDIPFTNEGDEISDVDFYVKSN